MKKILYISSNDPEYLNGGSIGTQKFIKVLKKLERDFKAEVYFFINGNKSSTSKIIYKKRNFLKTLISRLLGKSDQLSLYSLEIIKKINKEKIDIVILQSSRLGDLSEKIKKNNSNIKIIQNFDNFEYEFSRMYTSKMSKIIKKIELKNIKQVEKKATQNSDYNIFLTKEDYKKISEFYRVDLEGEIIPLIYSKPILRNLKTKINRAIFTGSLDMPANENAASFLINNLEKIKTETFVKEIVIAGRNPSLELVNQISEKKDIILYENPDKETMTSLIESSQVYLSPVFEGSGMKTKLLEAISHGIAIIASEHSLIGYDFFDIKMYNFIKSFKDYDIDDMIEKIQDIENIVKLKSTKKEVLSFYNQNFDEIKIINQIEKILMEKI